MLGAVMNNFAFEAPKAEPDKNKFGPNFAKNETSLGSCFAKMGTVPSEPKRGKPMLIRINQKCPVSAKDTGTVSCRGSSAFRTE